MNKLNVVKTTAGIVVSIGVGAIIGHAIKATTPADLKTINKIVVSIGTVALVGYLSMKASDYAENTIQEVADNFTQAKANIPTEI